MAGVNNPIQYPQEWDVLYAGDVASPGVIARGGIRGFDRQTQWDKKKGKGAAGATLTLTQVPPAEGSIKFLLWTANHFTQWDSFLTILQYSPTKEESQSIDIFHPALGDLGINSVVVKKIGPIYHEGKQLYSRTVDFVEWKPPPKTNATQTPSTATTTTDPTNPGRPVNPQIVQNKILIGQLSSQAGSP